MFLRNYKTVLLKIVVIFFFFISFSGSHYQEARPVFGVAFGYNQMNEFYHLVAYQQVGSNLINKRILRRDEFIYYFSGFYPSKYNPNRVNYFDKYEIWGGIYVDSLSGEKIPYCPALDSLWKIRYSEYPVGGSRERGWSNSDLNPSGGQIQYLNQRYHVKDIRNEYIIDTSFVQLLRDLTDSLWIDEYKRVN